MEHNQQPMDDIDSEIDDIDIDIEVDLDLTEQLLNNLPALSNMVRRVAVDAGDIILKYFDLPDHGQIEDKDDGSPVTLADREAEAFIMMSLQAFMPDIPVIGEESVALGQIPKIASSEYFWLVDPLDGTKEFIAGNDEFTVNIALIKDNRTVLGVVYAPATGILYAGHGEGTAIRWSQDTDKDKSVRVRPAPDEGLTIVASRNHGNDEKLNTLLESFKVKKLIQYGSSLKICAIAEGKADMYPRLGPTCEWDTAAAQAVLEAAGGVLTDMDGSSFTYGHKVRDFLNPEFVAASENWLKDM